MKESTEVFTRRGIEVKVIIVIEGRLMQITLSKLLLKIVNLSVTLKPWGTSFTTIIIVDEIYNKVLDIADTKRKNKSRKYRKENEKMY